MLQQSLVFNETITAGTRFNNKIVEGLIGNAKYLNKQRALTQHDRASEKLTMSLSATRSVVKLIKI